MPLLPNDAPTLFLICGKIAAGKSTLARDLAARPATILVNEDLWLSTLYPGEIATLEDYVRCSARIRGVLRGHIVSLLNEGISVVMDFPANTLPQRRWLKGLFETAGASHELHYIEASDELCKQRLRDRNQSGEHPFQPTETDFDLFTSYFVAPTPDEGFNLIVHRA